MRQFSHFTFLLFFVLLLCSTGTVSAEDVDYAKHVQPLLTKYCAGCHNDSDLEGKFSAESFKSLLKGADKKQVVVAGKPEKSLLLQLMKGSKEPAMPPEDEPQPTKEEIEKISRWITQGAHDSKAVVTDNWGLKVVTNLPDIQPKVNRNPITALAVHPEDGIVAVGRNGVIEFGSITNDGKWKPAKEEMTLKNLPGSINALHFSADGTQLIVAAGKPGIGGVAAIYSFPALEKKASFSGHKDDIYDAEISPDGRYFATCSYDRQIIIWETKTGNRQFVLSGHNGAVYDVHFSPDSQYLVSASADDTCKVWSMKTGLRIETLPQPLKEVYCCMFSPDGKSILAAGARQ